MRREKGEESKDSLLSVEWSNLRKRKSLTLILSLLKRERRNGCRTNADYSPIRSRYSLRFIDAVFAGADEGKTNENDDGFNRNNCRIKAMIMVRNGNGVYQRN
jgi:hypothetical protein